MFVCVKTGARISGREMLEDGKEHTLRDEESEQQADEKVKHVAG